MKHENFERHKREAEAMQAWARGETKPDLEHFEQWRNDAIYAPLDSSEVELAHTNEHPWCSDPKCPCHEVVTDEHMNEVYRRLIADPLLSGLITAKEANRIFFDEQV